MRSLTLNNGLALQQQSSNGDSSRAGQVFNGEAYIGLAHPTWGEFRFGRNAGVLADSILAYDPIPGSYAFSALGFSATVNGGTGATQSARLDSSIKYANAIGPVRLAALYGIAGDDRGGEAYEVGLGVDFTGSLKGLSVDGGYARKTDAIAASALSAANCTTLHLVPGSTCDIGLVNATISDNTVTTLLAKYAVGKATIYGGFETIHYANPSDPLTSGSALGTSVFTFSNNAFVSDRVLNVTWAGAKYEIAPHLTLAGAWYHFDQNNFATTTSGRPTSCTTAGQSRANIQSNCAGRENFVSFLVDYQITQRLELYAGAMWSEVSGGLASGFLQAQSIDPTIGARFRF